MDRDALGDQQARIAVSVHNPIDLRESDLDAIREIGSGQPARVVAVGDAFGDAVGHFWAGEILAAAERLVLEQSVERSSGLVREPSQRVNGWIGFASPQNSELRARDT